MGGLPEKGFKLRHISKNSAGRVLKVDSGNLFFKRDGRYAEGSPEAIQAAAVASVYTMFDYDAVAVGADDLAAGLGFLLGASDSGLPLVSANLHDQQGNLIFMPYLERTLGSLKIAITGITGPRTPVAADYHIAEPVEALGLLIPALEAEFDLIVLLSSLPVQATADILEKFPGIRIGISADKTKGNFGPEAAGKAIIVQTANRGQYLGALTIIYQGGPWRPSLNRAQQAQKEAELSAAGDNRFSTYRVDFLKMEQTGRSDAQVGYIIDQAKRQIRAAGK